MNLKEDPPIYPSKTDRSLCEDDWIPEQSLAQIFYDHLPVIGLTLDGRGVVQCVNKFAEATLGYSQRELQGVPFAEMLPASESDLFAAEIDMGSDRVGSLRTWESPVRKKDGSICWLRLTMRTIPPNTELSNKTDSCQDPNAPGMILVVGQEIPIESDRTLWQEQLERSNALLQGVLESSTNGILAVDNNGTTIASNDKFRQLWGLSPGNTGSQDAVVEAIAQQLKDPEAFIQLVQQFTTSSEDSVDRILELKDGRIFECSTQAQRSQNKIVGRIWTFQDITERSQTQATLQFTQLAIDRSAEAAFWLSANGQFCYVNDAACRSLGYPREQLLSMSIFDINPELSERNWRQEWQDLKQRGSFTLTSHKSSPNGTEIPLELTINYVEFNGEEYGCSFIHQLSQAKETEFSLRQQQKRQQILGQMASKIRQSLNADEILQTTVDEVRQLLQTDRVLVFRFNPDWSGKVIVESVASECEAILNETIVDPCFEDRYIIPYREGRVQSIEDIYTANLNQCHIDLLSQFQVRANLVVPILFNQGIQQGSSSNQQDKLPVVSGNAQLWGLLIAHHCRSPREWQAWEMDLLQQLGVHVAIAIQQSTLFEQLQATNKKLEHLASYDSLTQVANRRSFDNFLQKEWRRMLREESWLSLILCDIDYFKRYNDTYGHPAGDICLQQVAAAISSVVKRPADLVARYGGEEFVIVLPHTHLSGAVKVGQKIRLHINQLNIPHRGSLISDRVTMSMGIASIFPHPRESPNILIKAADRALYKAKETGRDRILSQRVSYV